MKDRKLKVEPKRMKSKIERDEPNRVIPYKDKADPARAKDRKLIELPRNTKSITLTELASRDIP
jgi:hypothetical protein